MVTSFSAHIQRIKKDRMKELHPWWCTPSCGLSVCNLAFIQAFVLVFVKVRARFFAKIGHESKKNAAMNSQIASISPATWPIPAPRSITSRNASAP